MRAPSRTSLVIPLLCAVIGQAAGATSDTSADLESANKFLVNFSLQPAYKAYSRLQPQLPHGTDEWQQATFGLAVTAHHLTPPTERLATQAANLYRQLVAEDGRFAPRALMHLGSLAELRDFAGDNADYVEARRCYREVIARWPDQPIASEAALRLAGAHIQTYETDEVQEGVRILEEHLAAHPDNQLAAVQWQYLGNTYLLPLMDYANAVRAYRNADAKGIMWRGKEGILWWRIAVIAERHLGDRDIAVAYYTRVVTHGAASGKGWEAQQALKRLGAPVPELLLDRRPDDTAAEPIQQETNQ